MNTKKAILATLTLSAILLVTSQSFAAEQKSYSGERNNKKDIREFRGNFTGSVFTGEREKMENHKGNPFEKFIDFSTLTDDQKASVKTILDNHKTNMDSLISQLTGATSEEEKNTIQTNIKSEKENFFTDLRQYVAQDKLSQFDEFTTKMKEENNDGKGFIKGENEDKKDFKSWKKGGDDKQNTGSGEKQIKKNNKYIKGATLDKLKIKLEAMSSDNLNTLLSKVNTAIDNMNNSTNTNKDTYVGIYGELKNIITDILSSSNDSTSNVIDSIING